LYFPFFYFWPGNYPCLKVSNSVFASRHSQDMMILVFDVLMILYFSSWCKTFVIGLSEKPFNLTGNQTQSLAHHVGTLTNWAISTVHFTLVKWIPQVSRGRWYCGICIFPKQTNQRHQMDFTTVDLTTEIVCSVFHRPFKRWGAQALKFLDLKCLSALIFINLRLKSLAPALKFLEFQISNDRRHGRLPVNYDCNKNSECQLALAE